MPPENLVRCACPDFESTFRDASWLMPKHSAARRRARKDNFMAKLVADGVEFDKQRGQARAATKNYKELYRKVRPSARSLRQTARAQHPPHTPSTACAQAKKKRLQRLDDAASPPMSPRPRCRP